MTLQNQSKGQPIDDLTLAAHGHGPAKVPGQGHVNDQNTGKGIYLTDPDISPAVGANDKSDKNVTILTENSLQRLVDGLHKRNVTFSKNAVIHLKVCYSADADLAQKLAGGYSASGGYREPMVNTVQRKILWDTKDPRTILSTTATGNPACKKIIKRSIEFWHIKMTKKGRKIGILSLKIATLSLCLIAALVLPLWIWWNRLPPINTKYYPPNSKVLWRPYPALEGERDTHYSELVPEDAIRLITVINGSPNTVVGGGIASIEIKVDEDHLYMYSNGVVAMQPGSSYKRGWRNGESWMTFLRQ